MPKETTHFCFFLFSVSMLMCLLDNTVHSCQVNLTQLGHNITGIFLGRPRPGSPKVTTVGQDWHMTLTHRRQHFKTAIEYDISLQTVLRLLCTGPAPIRPMQPYVGLVLNRENHYRLLF